MAAPDDTRLTIGRLLASDLPAVAQLHEHFWGEPSDVSMMTETLRRLDQDADHLLLAARVDGACVGTVTGVVCQGLYGGSDAYLVIEDLVVDPRHRRSGVASALVTELERFARDRSCKQMIVLTEACREASVGLYESLGFSGRWIGFKKKLVVEVTAP